MKKASLLICNYFISCSSVQTHRLSNSSWCKILYRQWFYWRLKYSAFNSRTTALEGSLLFYSGGLGIEGLYEYQAPIAGAEGLQYFVGGGGMLGFGPV